MKKVRFALIVLAMAGLWACAASSDMSATSADSANQGHQELKHGVYWYQKGCMRKAMTHFQAAHEHYSLGDRRVGIARSLNGLANVHRQQGSRASALLFYDAAEKAARRGGDRRVLAQVLANKAAVFIDDNDLAEAEHLLDEAGRLAGESGDVPALVLNYQAMMMMKAKREDRAAALLDRAAAVDFGNDPNIKATLQYSRGRLMLHAGQYPQAENLFTQALALDRQTECARCIAEDLAALADVHERRGEDEAALDCLARSLKIYALLENRTKVDESLGRLERLADKTGDDLRVTAHFIRQWLAGEAVDAICR